MGSASSTTTAPDATDAIGGVGVVDPAPAAAGPDPRDPRFFLNRELSWVDFDDRVLQLARDPDVPLLERVKFCSIFASNLDEFFMIRVAGQHDKVRRGVVRRGPDGRTADEVLDAIREKVQPLVDGAGACWEDELVPALAEQGVRIVHHDDLGAEDRRALAERYRRQLFPVLTPLAVGLGRPFPYLSNLSLNLGVLLQDPDNGQTAFARVKIPTEVVDRFVPIGDRQTFVPLEQLVEAHLDELFPGMTILHTGMFRVTRDADFEISDEEDDVKRALEAELRNRRFGETVRVEVDASMDPELRDELVDQLGVEDRQVYTMRGLLDHRDLMDLVGLPGHDDLRDEPWRPVTQPRLREGDDEQADLLSAMRRGDILVHHPYDSFQTSVERFVDQAVADPDVLAIKMTVYRTAEDTSLLPALVRATERGKQAVALVELKARFDEQANIRWAKLLEQAGVHVVYGHPALKTHAKCILVVRREGDGVRHYLHVGTGNYHARTARLYTDFGLFTTDPEIGGDVAHMLNHLTGFSKQGAYKRALVAPSGLRDGLLEEIERTVQAHREGRHARIRMKMNALVDRRSIPALYEASQAGVPIEINVRGICCLLPGVPGLSDTIRVTSVVGRFLEHPRVYAFERGDEQAVFIGSADLMERNLDNRVELVVPVRDPELRGEIGDVLDRSFADDTNSWDLRADGTWRRNRPADPAHPRTLHRELLERHRARAQAPEGGEDAGRD